MWCRPRVRSSDGGVRISSGGRDGADDDHGCTSSVLPDLLLAGDRKSRNQPTVVVLLLEATSTDPSWWLFTNKPDAETRGAAMASSPWSSMSRIVSLARSGRAQVFGSVESQRTSRWSFLWNWMDLRTRHSTSTLLLHSRERGS